MGLLVNGKWQDKWYDTKSTGGKFVRKDSSFRNFIGSEKHPVEKDRYHLYISHACPWAHRTAIFRKLKNLEDIITITVVNAYMGSKGWELEQDPINGKKCLHEVYTLADPNYTGRVTVPILWDKKEKTIVNNESSEIIRMFNTAFNQITGNNDDYYPEELRPEIDEINEYVYHSINNGVYKAGFATAQDVYDQEVTNVFDALDKIENILSKQKYLTGDKITEADWRLFTTLLRFDPVYVGHFKCNLQRIADYKHMSKYLLDLYGIPGIKDTINMDHIKTHYYASHHTINPNGIVPKGPKLFLS
jgi:putative glutathione S-transferase